MGVQIWRRVPRWQLWLIVGVGAMACAFWVWTTDYVIAALIAVLLAAFAVANLRVKPAPTAKIPPWEELLALAQPDRPSLSKIDPDHPLIGLVSGGDLKGKFVLIAENTDPDNWVYIAALRGRGRQGGRTDEDFKELRSASSQRPVKFLPQGAISNAIWLAYFRNWKL